MNADLAEVVKDAVDDAKLAPEPIEDAQPDTDPTPEPIEAPEAAEPVVEASSPEPSTAVSSPAAKTEPEDDFAKKFGLQEPVEGQRENRLPYSRVKKIVLKAEKDTEARVRKEFETFAKPEAFTELQTKLQDYEQRFQGVAQYEDVLVNNPDAFLEGLSKIPQYQPFFQMVGQMYQMVQQLQSGTPAADPADAMPQPNQELSDGTKVYDEQGLQDLFAWKERQIVSKVEAQYNDKFSQMEKRYAPIESEWQSQKRLESFIPKVKAQIEEAAKWDGFADNEADITKALQQNPGLSLEGAYRQVVLPKLKAEREKLSTDRNKIRSEILAEIKSTPTSTAASSRGSVKPGAQTGSGPKSLRDIVAEATQSLKN